MKLKQPRQRSLLTQHCPGNQEFEEASKARKYRYSMIQQKYLTFVTFLILLFKTLIPAIQYTIHFPVNY